MGRIVVSMAFLWIWLLAATTCAAWSEPDGVAGLKWGASEQEMARRYPKAALMWGSPESRVRWHPVSELKLGENLDLRAEFGFLDGGLAEVYLFRKSPMDLKELFEYRYGTPTIRTEAASVWVGRAVEMVAEPHKGRITHRWMKDYERAQAGSGL